MHEGVWLKKLNFEYHLPRLSFFTDSYCAGVSNKHCLLTFFIYSDNLHVDKYIQCQYIQDLTVSFKLICKLFPEKNRSKHIFNVMGKT